MPETNVTRLRAALAKADQPMRARALARELGLPRAEVTAELRRLQETGAVTSRDRRWAGAPAGAAPTSDDRRSH